MKKQIFFFSLFTLLMAQAFAYTPAFSDTEKQIDKVIKDQNIQVVNYQTVIDSIDQKVDSLKSGDITPDDIGPMVEGPGWFKNNWKWLLGLILLALQIIIKVKPTTANWDLVDKLFSILNWIWSIIPNNAKYKNDVIKRGFDRKTKRIIDAYKKNN